MSILDELCSGIQTKSVLQLIYDGERRVVRPHIVWTNKKGDCLAPSHSFWWREQGCDHPAESATDVGECVDGALAAGL